MLPPSTPVGSSTCVSVALCTYQGAQFLTEQLESIAAQTRLPDEVVVCDDGSTDATLDIVARFVQDAPFPVVVHQGLDRPLGPARNFERALRAARGDLIVLCDQDDIWHGSRIERSVQLLGDNPEAAAVFSDADLIDAEGRPIGETLWDALGISGTLEHRFVHGTAAERVALLWLGNLVTGATLTIRASHLDRLLPVADGWLHDYWFAMVLSSFTDMIMWPEPLCCYRLHPGQHTGIGVVRTTRGGYKYLFEVKRRARKNERALFRAQADGLTQVLDRICDLDPGPGVVEVLSGRRDHFAARASLAEDRRRLRLRLVAQELVSGRYHRYSSGVFGASKDILLTDVRHDEVRAR